MFPLFLIQPSVELIGLFVTVNAVTGLLEHANVDFNAGPLNYIFNTAQLHRWHHSPKVTISNKNFGKVLSIWDVFFSTWYLPKSERIQKVGVETEDIPSGMWRQFLHPFKGAAKEMTSHLP
jgi:sterol desaturase/sphingolipid hydroxylase (fatty acid hydroxylase superfamily)